MDSAKDFLIAAGSAFGNAALSASVEWLLEKWTSMGFTQYVGNGKIVDELNKWKNELKKIEAVLDDAEEKQWRNPLVEMWVRQLRDLVYDVEDVVDELNTENEQRNLKAEQQAGPSKLQKVLSTLSASMNPSQFKFSAEMVSKIERISGRLNEILKEKDELQLGKSSRSVGQRLPSTSLVDDSKIYGRENDTNAILELLKAEPSNAKVSVIAILGMGGVGKTTLAQLVFNDATLDFDFKSWVSVGEDFDVLKITRTIEGGNENKDLNWHQTKLKEKLHQKKCLIVLDDVWTESPYLWELFCVPFELGAPGSRILVTTRNESVSLMMGAISSHCLKELSQDDCLSVFAHCALGEVSFDKHLHLKEKGKEIVRRGLPLAAKALGGLLRGRLDPDALDEVLKSNIWDLPEDKCRILPALKLSYFHLPYHLKRCFAYCAMFPKDFEFDRNELVLLWMAEGFVNGPGEMQKLGCKYFNQLLSRSFLQQSGSDKSQYVMHDLMHDLAKSVAGETCFHFGDKLEDSNLFAKVRHSAYTSSEYGTWQKFKDLSEMQSLRTFIALPIMPWYWGSSLARKVVDDMVLKLRSLRVLSLASYEIEELPSSIGDLKSLRYLNLSYTDIKRLPESVAHLFNLQTLRLKECYQLIELPQGICELINLHCLDISGCRNITKLPLGITNLKNLQCLDVSQINNLELPPQIGDLRNLCRLSDFVVGKDRGLKLSELKKLSQLQGKLCIRELQNVVDIGDAGFADLNEKHGIEQLEVVWAWPSGSSDELEVLNSLRPHENLSNLSISGFGETALPSWIGDPSFSKMVKLNLRDCSKVTSLPPLVQLGALRELSIEGLNGVKEVGVELCSGSLETLRLENMEEWEKWCFSDDVNEEASVIFPKLRELRIVNCPNLVGKLPSCLPSLQELFVARCRGTLVCNMCDLIYLTKLVMIQIAGLVSLDEVHIKKLVALKHLKILDCEKLEYLWEDGTNLDKLKTIVIKNCKQMVSLVKGEEGQLPCNLQSLVIHECDNLEIGGRAIFKSCNLQLECLDIKHCQYLKWSRNVEFPDSLKTLTLDIWLSNWSTGLMESLSGKLDSPNGFSRLTKLQIANSSHSLLSSLQNLISLQHLDISYNDHLNCIQNLTSLQFLVIRKCENLNWMQNLISLQSLSIDSCKNLRSLPNLTSLQSLCIKQCGWLESFPDGSLPPKLTDLEIIDCKNLSQPMSEWGLDRLTSLTKLKIKGTIPSTKMLDSFPDDNMRLPAFLNYLSISDFKNLKSISNLRWGLPNLTTLVITSCPNLRSLPEEIGFPSTFEYVQISGCPLVKERDHRSLISHIPRVYITNEGHVDYTEPDDGYITDIEGDEEYCIFN